jgi:hypothetical protein
MHALDIGTGAVIWEENNNQSFGPTTLADGVVFSGFIGFEVVPEIRTGG